MSGAQSCRNVPASASARMTVDEWVAWEPDYLAVIYGVKPMPLGLTIIPNPPGEPQVAQRMPEPVSGG